LKHDKEEAEKTENDDSIKSAGLDCNASKQFRNYELAMF